MVTVMATAIASGILGANRNLANVSAAPVRQIDHKRRIYNKLPP
jgi:hypothetical protein